MSKRRGPGRVSGWVVALGLLAGCQAEFRTPDDGLRRERLELERALEDAEQQIAVLTAELEAERATRNPPAVEGANPPVLTRIALDRYSSAMDMDGDEADDTVRAYVMTFDQLDRQLPVTARAYVQVVASGEDIEPVVLGEATYSPDELDAAYRTGVTGTHYTLEVPIGTPPSGVNEATLRVELTEGVTGQKHTTQAPLPLVTSN